MRKIVTILFAGMMLMGVASAAQAEMKTYVIDPDHSTVGFGVRHMFTNLKGQFHHFSGAFQLDAKNGIIGSGKAVVETASVDTGHVKRDKHLKSPDFFNSAKFPAMTFVIKKTRQAGKNIEVAGDFTLLGVTRPVVLKARFLGVGVDPWGNTRAGLTAVLRINRKDYGMDFNKVLDSGGLLIGDQIDINLEIEGIQK